MCGSCFTPSTGLQSGPSILTSEEEALTGTIWMDGVQALGGGYSRKIHKPPVCIPLLQAQVTLQESSSAPSTAPCTSLPPQGEPRAHLPTPTPTSPSRSPCPAAFLRPAEQGFSASVILTFQAGYVFVLRLILCSSRWVTVFLSTIHQMPITFPTSFLRPKISPDIAKRSGGGRGKNHTGLRIIILDFIFNPFC